MAHVANVGPDHYVINTRHLLFSSPGQNLRLAIAILARHCDSRSLRTDASPRLKPGQWRCCPTKSIHGHPAPCPTPTKTAMGTWETSLAKDAGRTDARPHASISPQTRQLVHQILRATRTIVHWAHHQMGPVTRRMMPQTLGTHQLAWTADCPTTVPHCLSYLTQIRTPGTVQRRSATPCHRLTTCSTQVRSETTTGTLLRTRPGPLCCPPSFCRTHHFPLIQEFLAVGILLSHHVLFLALLPLQQNRKRRGTSRHGTSSLHNHILSILFTAPVTRWRNSSTTSGHHWNALNHLSHLKDGGTSPRTRPNQYRGWTGNLVRKILSTGRIRTRQTCRMMVMTGRTRMMSMIG